MKVSFCPHCGAKSPSLLAQFCMSCGESLTSFEKKKAVVKTLARKVVSDDDEPDDENEDDDDDGTDITELPDLNAVRKGLIQANKRGDLEDLAIGGSSFAFGPQGFVPTNFRRIKK